MLNLLEDTDKDMRQRCDSMPESNKKKLMHKKDALTGEETVGLLLLSPKKFDRDVFSSNTMPCSAVAQTSSTGSQPSDKNNISVIANKSPSTHCPTKFPYWPPPTLTPLSGSRIGDTVNSTQQSLIHSTTTTLLNSSPPSVAMAATPAVRTNPRLLQYIAPGINDNAGIISPASVDCCGVTSSSFSDVSIDHNTGNISSGYSWFLPITSGGAGGPVCSMTPSVGGLELGGRNRTTLSSSQCQEPINNLYRTKYAAVDDGDAENGDRAQADERRTNENLLVNHVSQWPPQYTQQLSQQPDCEAAQKQSSYVAQPLQQASYAAPDLTAISFMDDNGD